jgi:hypothetical protein
MAKQHKDLEVRVKWRRYDRTITTGLKGLVTPGTGVLAITYCASRGCR